MNEQQGKLLDRRVRQALAGLPDNVPVPGTAFNAGRLWEQLRPELAVQPVSKSKRIGQVRWLVAASLAGLGLFVSWLLRIQPGEEVPPTSGQVAGYVNRAAPGRSQERTRPEQKSPAFLPELERRMAERQLVTRTKKGVDLSNQALDSGDVQPALTMMNVPAQANLRTIAPDSVLTGAAPDQPTSAPVNRRPATTYPKRRFAVVHQNELRAEAETQANLERNDRFVRLGGPPLGTSPVSPSEERPGLIIPLN